MQNIKRVSHFFFWLFIVILVLMPILNLLFWMNSPAPLYFFGQAVGFHINEIPQSITLMHQLAGSTKFFAFLIGLIPLAIEILVVYFLIRLFALFKRGELFALENVICIKRVGIALFASQIIDPFYQAALSTLLTYGNPPGHRYITVTVSGVNVGIVLAALLIVLVSWIMAEGLKLKEEQSLTV